MEQPSGVKVTVFIYEHELLQFLKGDYTIAWSTSRVHLNGLFNHIVELQISIDDYITLSDLRKEEHDPFHNIFPF
jgi:hypothetical protein